MSPRTFTWCQWTLAAIISVLLIFPFSYYVLTEFHLVKTFDFGPCKIIGKSSSSDCVSGLQKLLNEENPSDSAVPVDGRWGPQTENAITAFQENNGLAADGIPWTQTYDKLNGHAHRVGIQSYATSFLDSRQSWLSKILVIIVLAGLALPLKLRGACAWVCTKPFVVAGLVGAASAEASHLMSYGWVPNAIGFSAAFVIGALAEALKRINFSISLPLSSPRRRPASWGILPRVHLLRRPHPAETRADRHTRKG